MLCLKQTLSEVVAHFGEFWALVCHRPDTDISEIMINDVFSKQIRSNSMYQGMKAKKNIKESASSWAVFNVAC